MTTFCSQFGENEKETHPQLAPLRWTHGTTRFCVEQDRDSGFHATEEAVNLWTLGPGHLGDACWSLNAIRKIDGEHMLFCPTEYHGDLQALCEDRDIKLSPMEQAPPDARCTWIGNQRFAHKGVAWAMQADVVNFLCAWSEQLSIEAGSPRVFERHDMLADWPIINRHVHDVPEFDALVINAAPRSGQCPRWDNGEMNTLIQAIAEKNRVVCTNPTTATGGNITVVQKTIGEIGALSLRAKFVVAVATGPSWGIHSIFDRTIQTFLFLDSPLHLDYGDNPMPHHGLVLGGMLPELQVRNLI
jgi:hypothetical protein